MHIQKGVRLLSCDVVDDGHWISRPSHACEGIYSCIQGIVILGVLLILLQELMIILWHGVTYGTNHLQLKGSTRVARACVMRGITHKRVRAYVF